MKHLPILYRWALLIACLVFAAAPAAHIVKAHVPETIALSSAIRPETLSAGAYHACAIRTDGTVACWGDNAGGRATPPTGTFTQVAAGHYHTCGLKTDGEAACWGEELFIEPIPDGTFKQISAGDVYTCGIDDFGYLECWGEVPMDYGPFPSPGQFIQIDAGFNHACGVKKDGTLACWGDNTDGKATPPEGDDRFTQVVAGSSHSCGLKTDSTVECWGNYLDDTPSGTFTSISAFQHDTCGITSSGTAICWMGSLTPPPGTFTQVTAGMSFACGGKTDGTLACWAGDPDHEILNSPDISIGPPKISAGSAHACTLNNDGSLQCWGSNSDGQTTPPEDEIFQQVSSGGYHSCGIQDDGTLACWGHNNFDQASPPAGTFSQVSAGNYHSCGLKNDGTMACWGDNSQGQSDDQTGVFTQVSAGGTHSCAIRSEDNKLFCWGKQENYDVWAGSLLFEENLIQISAGSEHICGLTYDSAVRCGGSNEYGQAPDGMGLNNIQVSAGNYHTCSLKSDGTLHCRGKNDSGQASPPPGTFVEVSAGNDYTCAVRSDSRQVCWGANLSDPSRLSLSPANPPDGIVGSEYDQTFLAEGGTGSYAFSVAGGSLPDGLTLSAGGALTGTPTASGTFTFGIQVVDAADPNFAIYRGYTITVNQPAFNKSSPLHGATDQLLSLELDWEDISGASYYEYCYDSSNDNACSGWTSTGTTSQASISGLSYSTTYYWQVRAVNTAGTIYANGSPASYRSFITQAAPPVYYTLSVSKTGTGSGTVTSSPPGINCGIDCSELCLSGSSITLTATPAAGSTFSGWSGACTGTGSCVVSMTSDRSVTAAIFTETKVVFIPIIVK